MQELNHEYNRGFQTIDYRWSYSISSGDVRGVIQNALLTHQKMFNPKSAAFSGYPSVSLSPQGFFYTSSCEQADIIQTVYLLSCVRIKSTGTSKKSTHPCWLTWPVVGEVWPWQDLTLRGEKNEAFSGLKKTKSVILPEASCYLFVVGLFGFCCIFVDCAGESTTLTEHQTRRVESL